MRALGRASLFRALAFGLALAALPAATARGAERRHDMFPLELLPSTPVEIERTLPPETEPAELRPAHLTLVFFDPGRALPGGFAGVAREVQRFFRELGVEASWREGGSFGESPIPEVPVIVLPRPLVPRPGQNRVLGLVVRNQEPQRAVWLFAENVRRVLGRPAAQPYAGPDFDVALARVASHEIVHAVNPDEPHAREGLMRHSLTREFLVGDRAPIDTRCASSFVSRLAEEQRRFLIRSSRGSASPEAGADAFGTARH
jgi:hypothetical protein